MVTFNKRINAENVLNIIDGFDIICDCSDNFGTRYLINDACLILDKPLVFGCVQGFEGQISVFNLNKNKLSRENPRDFIYTGCQILNKKILSNFSNSKFSINDVWNILIKENNLFGFESKNKFIHVTDIKVYESLLKNN